MPKGTGYGYPKKSSNKSGAGPKMKKSSGGKNSGYRKNKAGMKKGR